MLGTTAFGCPNLLKSERIHVAPFWHWCYMYLFRYWQYLLTVCQILERCQNSGRVTQAHWVSSTFRNTAPTVQLNMHAGRDFHTISCFRFRPAHLSWSQECNPSLETVWFHSLSMWVAKVATIDIAKLPAHFGFSHHSNHRISHCVCDESFGLLYSKVSGVLEVISCMFWRWLPFREAEYVWILLALLSALSLHLCSNKKEPNSWERIR